MGPTVPKDRRGARAAGSEVPFLRGGGDMGARLRAVDWAATPLGPAAQWPQSLKTAVRIMLTSRQPMFVWWGDDLINLYNDAYRAIVGGKHPDALGQPASVVWREIWDEVGPRARSVMQDDEGTYDEALLLIMERYGYPEETYYTFSYSPVPNDDGGTGGIICANTDDTRRIVGERQLALLRELAAQTTDARTFDEACSRSAAALGTNPRDLPFAMIYLVDPAERCVRLAGTSGIGRDHPAVRARVTLDDDGPWPFAEVLATHRPSLVSGLADLWPDLPTGAWGRPPHQAVLLPIAPSGQTGKAGVLVAGLNPFRLLDDGYRGFLELVSAQIAASIANAHAYEEERTRAEALAELDRAKTAFFSNVSHEFRTPLTLMLGPLEELLDDEPSPERREALALLQRNALRLQKLVNALLDFSRLEAGRLQVSYEPTDLATYTADLASAFRSACERAGLALIVDCPPLPAPVHVDRDLWEKIVLNLLSNAFKFTFAGSITVRLRAVDGAAELTVTDTGIGIAAEQLPHVFERFHRIDGARARTHEGTGIGLALVQELAHLHAGSVRVSSAIDAGSTFVVSIPTDPAGLPADRIGAPRSLAPTSVGATPYVIEAMRWTDGHPPALAPVVQASGARPRVLLADDNADMRDYVTRLLGEDYDVEAVADGVTALAMARRRPPDLVVSDVMMPRLDGVGLLRALRADDRTRLVPIILLSARAGEEARLEGLQGGADDYLVKPFSARELLVRVGACLRLARVRTQTEAALREADRRKDEFLATLAHELRNPLAPIRNALGILRIAGDASTRHVHEMMERQVNHMVRLVDDLLEVSRITRGSIELRRERVTLGDVVASAIETSRPLIDAARHHLVVALPSEAMVLDADPFRLSQVFANLLNNAARYTDGGGHIALTAHREGDVVVVSVRDDGIGIPPDLLPTVFDVFMQVAPTRRAAQGGLGIGLTLVRRLVEMHAGTVEARSDGTGRGSEFVVRLPLAAGTGVAAPARNGATPAPASRRVLVVDDNRDAAESLAMLLDVVGMETQIAHDGPSALAVMQTFRPSTVLLDVGMPGMDGHEVARRIRQQPEFGAVQLIALTGWGQPDDRRRSRDAGFDHHLVKPVDMDALQSLLCS